MTKFRHYQLNLKFFASLFWVISLLLCGSPTHLHAATITNIDIKQNKTVTGNVVSADDSMGIPGVNVLVKGTSTGAVTDFDGNYSINIPSNGAILVFSYLGYVTQEVTIGTNTSINVTMQSDIAALDEVVVVGYGTKTKATLTGAVEVVKSETFQDRAVTNPILALQGASPGLTVSRNSSRPGDSGADFQIRGASSINGDNSPLIVVDGVPGADFARINPDDIESISILKDASASIYGARSGNGVVLVTTKKGKSGKMSININSQVRVNTLGIKPQSTSAKEYFDVYVDFMESDEAVLGFGQYDAFAWLNLDNARSIRDRFAAGDNGFYVDSFFGTLVNPNDPSDIRTDLYLVNNNIWDQVYGTSISNQQNISISGGNDKVDFRISGMYEEEIGAVDITYDGEIQYNLRTVINAQVTDRLKVGTNVSLNHFKLSQPSATLTGSVFTNDPAIYPTVNPYGQWVANFNHVGGGRQPIANLVDGGRNFEERDRLNMTFNATYKITNHLDFQANAAFIINRFDDVEYDLEVPIYSYDGLRQVNTVNNGNSSFQTEFGTGRTDFYGALLKYKNTFKEKHNLVVTAGVNTEDRRTKEILARRIGFEDQGVYNIESASEDIQTNTGRDFHEGIYGIIGNIDYGFQDKYLATLTVRRDGSSRFASEVQWDNFLSGSLGWVVSKEKFMENVGFLDFLKLRVSYGESANAFAGLDRFEFVSQIDTGTVLFGDSPTQFTTANVDGITSRNRTWERIEQSNFGLDFHALNNKLSGSFDYFIKQNVGMFISVDFPFQLGDAAPRTNDGLFENKGWEVSLKWQNKVNNDFSYSVGAFLSDTRTDVINRGGINQPNSGINTAIQGYSLSSLWVYKTDGIFQNQGEVDAYYDQFIGTNGENILNDNAQSLTQTDNSRNITPGDIRKVDVNGDGILNQDDLVNAGDVLPHYTFGINLSANYKGFDLSALFQGVGEQNVIRTGVFAYPGRARFTNQTDQYLGQTWTPTNTDAAFPRTTTRTIRSDWNWSNNDFTVQNNRYIRLKQLTFGYTLPKLKLGDIDFNKIRVYFSGNDLWEASSLNDGWDPEYGSSTANTYPFTRTWAFGINVNF